MKKSSIFAACLLGAAAVAQPAAAETVQSSVAVVTDDLDLNSAAGQEKLERRLTAAVRKVCGRYDVRVMAERRQHLECTKIATRDVQNSKRAAIEASRRVALAAAAKRPNVQL